jgi:integrase
MVFRPAGRKAWKARVRHPDGRARVCGCDTESRATARQMEQWARQLYNDRTPQSLAVLDMIVSGRSTLPRAYDARANLDDLLVAANDVDLEPWVDRWQAELKRRKKPGPEQRAKMLMQVRRLIPAGQPFLRSRFTKQAIRDWLDSLNLTAPNRYRSALSSFAQYLAFEDVLVGNPVRLVPMAKENDPRLHYLSQIDAKKLVGCFTNERYKALHCVLLATGMEISAAVLLDPGQCTETSVYAHGTKTDTRQRTAHIYDRWQWAWRVALAFIEKSADGQRPFAGVITKESNAALRRALKKAGLDVQYTQHDHRHTWAVQAIRDGLSTHVVAYQLGHKNDLMVRKVYGRFIPDGSDFAGKVTPGVPTPLVKHEVTDAK